MTSRKSRPEIEKFTWKDWLIIHLMAFPVVTEYLLIIYLVLGRLGA